MTNSRFYRMLPHRRHLVLSVIYHWKYKKPSIRPLFSTSSRRAISISYRPISMTKDHKTLTRLVSNVFPPGPTAFYSNLPMKRLSFSSTTACRASTFRITSPLAPSSKYTRRAESTFKRMTCSRVNIIKDRGLKQ